MLAALKHKSRSRETCLEADAIIKVDQGGGSGYGGSSRILNVF